MKLTQKHIQSCCFAKDTQIQMADRSLKPVSELRAGDQLLGEGNKTLLIKDIVSGDEERVFNIRTEGGKGLLVTGMHPLSTNEGALRARDIKPRTKLRCVDGCEDEVTFAYIIDYHDKVYNIVTTDGGHWVAANGIWAGDFDLQNGRLMGDR